LEKAPDAFRTISEVADEIDVPQHVLRFWESRFTQIRPMKRGGGRRYYRPDDVDLLRGVRHLLYGEGYTIRGVQRILREQGVAFVQEVWEAGAQAPPPQSEEDRAADDSGDEASGIRAEPNLFAVAPSPPVGEALEPKVSLAPAPLPGIPDEDRRKLQAALDELVACRRLIDGALGRD
jgi:DNA-binding transcriptional MerR regulator